MYWLVHGCDGRGLGEMDRYFGIGRLWRSGILIC